MNRYIIFMIVLFFTSTAYSSPPSKEDLKNMGQSAYANNNCLDTIKYLFAYLIVEDTLDQEKKTSIEAAITYCESVLAPVRNVAGWASGTMGVLSAGGSLKPIKFGSGGVLITSGGNLRTIDISTGGVLITTEGVLSKAPDYMEYFSKNKSNPIAIFEKTIDKKNADSLDFLIKKKRIELDALGDLQKLYNPKLDINSLTNGSTGLPNAAPLRSAPSGSQ